MRSGGWPAFAHSAETSFIASVRLAAANTVNPCARAASGTSNTQEQQKAHGLDLSGLNASNASRLDVKHRRCLHIGTENRTRHARRHRRATTAAGP